MNKGKCFQTQCGDHNPTMPQNCRKNVTKNRGHSNVCTAHKDSMDSVLDHAGDESSLPKKGA